MEKLLDPHFVEAQLLAIKDWVFTEILGFSSLGQLAVIAIAFLIARVSRPKIDQWIKLLANWKRAEVWFIRLINSLAILSLPLVWIILQWLSSLVAAYAKWPHHLLTVTVSLLTAWIIIRLTSVLIRDKTWAKLIATSAWIIAALNIINLLDPTIAFLDSMSLNMGDLRLSALTVIKGMIALAALLWLAQFSSRLLERRISQLPNITPSVQVLFTKLFKIVVITIAIFAAMSSVGIDLTAFAVFSGAIGVGIGFGLQKIFSNLISGLLILADKSIKPGDVIEVAGTYGWINTLGGRYASVITRDGIEHLIPNEELISQRVSNWTYSDTQIRIKLPIGVSYDTDLPTAIQTCIEAAMKEDRILDTPEPACLIKGFGDSSIDLEMRVWIDDPHNGISNIKSAVFLQIWQAFKENDIQVPFPQRDVHIVGGGPSPVAEFAG